MKHEIIPDELWEIIRNDFITSQLGPYALGKKHNVRGNEIKRRALLEQWRKMRSQWQDQKILPDTVHAEPVLTTNISEPIVKDFFYHYWRKYVNMLPRLCANAERISDALDKVLTPEETLQLVTARERILERTRSILGVMAPGQIKDIPKPRKLKFGPPVPTVAPPEPFEPTEPLALDQGSVV